jgi:hypothetical protein
MLAEEKGLQEYIHCRPCGENLGVLNPRPAGIIEVERCLIGLCSARRFGKHMEIALEQPLIIVGDGTIPDEARW